MQKRQERKSEVTAKAMQLRAERQNIARAQAARRTTHNREAGGQLPSQTDTASISAYSQSGVSTMYNSGDATMFNAGELDEFKASKGRGRGCFAPNDNAMNRANNAQKGQAVDLTVYAPTLVLSVDEDMNNPGKAKADDAAYMST